MVGSGPDGSIIASDIEKFVPTAAPAAAPAAPAPPLVPGATYTDIPLSNVRQVHKLKKIVKTGDLSNSNTEIVPVYVFISIR